MTGRLLASDGVAVRGYPRHARLPIAVKPLSPACHRTTSGGGGGGVYKLLPSVSHGESFLTSPPSPLIAVQRATFRYAALAHGSSVVAYSGAIAQPTSS